MLFADLRQYGYPNGFFGLQAEKKTQLLRVTSRKEAVRGVPFILLFISLSNKVLPVKPIKQMAEFRKEEMRKFFSMFAFILPRGCFLFTICRLPITIHLHAACHLPGLIRSSY